MPVPRKTDSGGRDGIFFATYDRDASVHFEKSRQLHTIAVDSGFFVAPQPLAISPDKRELQWEFLEGLVPMRQALPKLSQADQDAMSEKCGRALATIHRDLQLEGDPFDTEFVCDAISDRQLRESASQILASSPICNVHGDFACANLFLTKENQVATLDPEPNLYLFNGAAPNVRVSIYLELALLVQSLQSNPQFSRSMGESRLESIAEHAVRGYESGIGNALHRQTVFSLAAAIMKIYARYRRNNRAESRWTRWLEYRFRNRLAKQLFVRSQSDRF